jgi:oxygen-independent coproporphyrinogen-3 oxidase
MKPFSLYIHIPFCKHRCAYCDFNTYAGLENLIEPYMQALCHEIRLSSRSAYQAFGAVLPLHTIFFGGGTPSLIPAKDLEMVIDELRAGFDISPAAEISLEANPGTLSLEYFYALRGCGINRLSLGMQSANPGELRLLERIHSTEDVIQAVDWAQKVGIENFNLDLIFGLPYQSLESWRNTLALALSTRAPHLSLYALTLEHGTPMEKWVSRGLLTMPDSDLAADMYEYASEKLDSYGYTQYEISNWAARPELACLHNLQYWRSQPWLGLGAGAHGYVPGTRTVTTLTPAAYIQRLSQSNEPQPFPLTPATAEVRSLTAEDERGEFMMMGLRLVEEGVSDAEFTARFGANLAHFYAKEITRLQSQGLLEWVDQSRLRLTKKGRLLGNRVFVEFI